MRYHLEIAVSQTGEWLGDHDMYTTLVDTAALQRDGAAIRKYAPRAEALANALGHPLYQATVHRAWGVAHRLAAEYSQSEARLKQALEVFNSLQTRWQIGRTWFELGELAFAQGMSAEARDAYALALANFEFMRAAPDMAQTRAALAALT